MTGGRQAVPQPRDFAFFLSCRELLERPGTCSLADLILDQCPDREAPVQQMLAQSERLLFILDGVDEMLAPEPAEAAPCRNPHEAASGARVLGSLLSKELLPAARALVTRRGAAPGRLQARLCSPQCAEVCGFSDKDRKKYFYKFFQDEWKAEHAYRSVKENEMLFSLCFVPAVCWIVCTVLRQQHPAALSHLHASAHTHPSFAHLLTPACLCPQARSLQAVPRLVKLFNHANQEVQRHATGAMRNLVYDNADNKLALVEENGIFELLRALREQDDELRKNVTGILWNLSSSDRLKDRLARDTLEQLADLVLSPLSGAGGPPLIQQNASEAEIFYNATGFLRNLSSASQATRQKMRECHGLVDALVTYINHALDVGKCEDKSVENAVCVLRNLSYRLYDEMPPSALQRLEGRGRQDMGVPPGEAVGCFTPQSRRLRELPLTADALTFAEVSKDPKGLEWLWSPQIVGLYNRLLQRCELNRHTTEAAAGALQNITAGDRRWAGVLSRLALEQERILNPLLDRVRTADHHQLRSLTGLIRNLSRNARNKDEMSTKLVSHLIEKLPGSVGEKSPPADVLINIIAVLNNLVVASPVAARDLLYFDGLRKLVFIKKKRDSPDSEKSSRAASSLLANLWQYNKLHRDFRAKGYRKEDFLGP
ncbi:PREDICTED: plakophilin-3 [Capra hircus]|nr:PREDICTED: plakophilin-3 [Capra hircus]